MTFPLRGLFIVLLLAGIQMNSSGQEIIIPEQSTATEEKAPASQPKQEKQGYGMLSMFSGNPGRAALCSLAIPGGGQLYNKKYWKIPIVLAIEGGVIALVIDRVKTYRLWDNGMKNFTVGDTFMDRTSLSDIKAVRDVAQANRDYAIISLVIVHLFQTAEAFVNRHLIEFDVSEDLTITIPDYTPVGVSLTYRFN